MIFSGECIRIEREGEIARLTIDAPKANVFGTLLVNDFTAAMDALEKENSLAGLIVQSAKDHFVLGADITEFSDYFKKGSEEIMSWLGKVQTQFNRLEDLPYPTVTAINSFALGGGLEVCLATDYRLAGADARVGLPETKLGILPGWGGCVRLPRLIGADNAIELIAGGKQLKAADALKYGLVDGVVANEILVSESANFLKHVIENFDWKSRREQKKSPLQLNRTEAAMTFNTSKAFVGQVAGKNYPAPMAVIDIIERGLKLGRDEALKIEAENFAKVAQTPVAEGLINIFLGEQALKRKSKKMTKDLTPVTKAAVLGAGIMGGGIAYQSASKGTPILMKDINQKALDLGLNEASKLLGKLVTRGKMDANKMAKTLNAIDPTLSYEDFQNTQVVIEAVVEDPKIKAQVLSDVENHVSDDCIIASNTSTISINTLAESTRRPENFCGMHFFNPVHRMPLVEIIRGTKTSDQTIARCVQYALQMGKTPVVVNDCPGFLVNRVLFPYFNGFDLLVRDGVDFKRIDKVMEKFGWPMGPAYLLDVVGIDTGYKANAIMANAFPDRMQLAGTSVLELLYKANRYGQKNSKGLYKYELDRKGKPKKMVDEEVNALIAPVVKATKEVSDEDIIMRMMLPMITESARCLEENIVASASEADMALIFGLGLPPFRGGIFKYVDQVGIPDIVAACDKFSSLGKMYQATEGMKALAKENKTYY